MIDVVVADDAHLVRAGFRRLLEDTDDIRVVGEAADGAEAVDVVSRTRPHVVLMDVRMPVADGLDATRRIVATLPDTRVVMLTTFDLDEYVYEALAVGASGFLLKDTPYPQLLHAIRVVAAGEAFLAPSVTRRMVERFAATRPKEPPPPLETLTDREREIWRLIAQGLSNAEIGAELYLAETTVKTHVGRLLAKLGVRDRVQAVILAFTSGAVPL